MENDPERVFSLVPNPYPKILFQASISLICYAVVIWVSTALSAGGPFIGRLGNAAIFGTIFVVFTFPVLVGVGFVLRWVLELVLSRSLPFRSIVPWWTHIPLSITFIIGAIPESSEGLFRRYVADEVPLSLSEVRFWRTSGFGNSIVMLSYRIDSKEFEKVLERFEYEERSGGTGMPPPFFNDLANAQADFPISLPASPLVYEYSYSEPGSGGGLNISHYATEQKDFVLTIRMRD